jgi:hypothetical protein
MITNAGTFNERIWLLHHQCKSSLLLDDCCLGRKIANSLLTTSTLKKPCIVSSKFYCMYHFCMNGWSQPGHTLMGNMMRDKQKNYRKNAKQSHNI